MRIDVNTYPATLVPDDDGTILAIAPDVPGAISCGDDEGDALANLSDALETVISGLISDRKEIPFPSPCSAGPKVSLSLLGSLKVAAYRAMRERGWRKADLARAMGLNPRQIDRLLDLRHASTVAQLEQALAACGKRAEVETKALRAD